MKNILGNSNFGFTKWCVAAAAILAISDTTQAQSITSLELGTSSLASNTNGSATFTSKNTNISVLPSLTLSAGQQGQAGGAGYISSKAWPTNTTVDTNAYWQFTVTAASGYKLTVTNLAIRGHRSSTGPTNLVCRSDADSYASNLGGVQAVPTASGTISFANLSISNKSAINFRLYGYQAGATAGTFRIGDGGAVLEIDVQGSVAAATPTIAVSGTPTALSTTYGTNSSSTSFTVSGSNLNGTAVVVRPPSGFQVATTSDFSTAIGTSASELSLGTSATINPTTIYVRLPGTATVGSSPYSGNIVISGGGATSQNVATASSTVSKKALTITAANQTVSYGSAEATVTGMGSYTPTGFVNGDTSSVIGGTASYSTTYTAATAAGSNVATITPDTTSLTASNYSFNPVNGNITVTAIVPSAPTISTITAGNGQLSVAFSGPSSSGGDAVTNYEYSLNGGSSWTARSPANTASPLTISSLSNGTLYDVQIRAVNSAGGGTASSTVQGTPVAPANPTITLGSSSLASAMTTTYGTASSPQSFTVSGTALNGNLTVSAPTGFEISTSSDTGYAGSLVLTQSGGSVSSQSIYVRLAEITGAGTCSGNVSISGGGATTQNVATVSSTVAPKTLSITGATATNREYNGSTTIEVGGGSLSGVINNDAVTLGGSPAGTVTSAAAGTDKAVAVAGYSISGASSGNYVLTQPTSLTANITAKALTVANAAVTSRAYDGTDVATITGTLDGVVDGEVVTFNGTGTFANPNAGTGIAVMSTSSISGAQSGNYSLSQPTGLTGTITQATQTITFNPLANKVAGDADFQLDARVSSSLPLTYASSNSGVATVSSSGLVTIVGAGTTDITVSQAGNSNYLAAADVTRTLTVTPKPLLSWDVNSLTAYGPSPFSPTKTNVNLTVVGLARGVGIATSGTAAGNAWGGVDLQAADATSAINGGDFVTFSITPKSGYQVSFSQIPAYNIRRSSTGPTKGIWQYQKGSGSFTNIDSNSITWGAITSGTGGNTQLPIDLSGITDLQNVPSGTTVTFRIVSWGGTGNTGSWYINNIAGDDLAVMGTVSEYTAVVPSLSSFTPNFGATGSTVTISGSSLLAVTGVKFNGQSAVFTRSSDQTITATVPAGIQAGKISLIYGSPQEEVLSTTNFEPLDGSGLATVANGDGTSPYVNTAIFGKGQSNNQTLAVTVNNPIVNSAISTVRITLPSDFTLPNSPSFSLSGAGTVSVSGRALTVEGAVVTSDSPLTVTISGLSTPDTSVSTALDGNYGITVETAGAGGTLANVLVAPTAYVLVPIINLRGVDANGVPTQLGKKVAFEGVVTASGLGSAAGRTKAYVQDASAAVYIYSAAFTSAPIQGNVYAALGTLNQFRGGTEIDPGTASNLIDRGAGVLPEPTVLTLPISSTDGERYEGSLVKVVGLSRVAGGTGWPTGAAIPMQDSAAATVDLFLQPSSTATTEPANYPVTVVGILGQLANASPYTTGYRLQPRTQADLIVPPSGLSYADINATVGTPIGNVNPTVTGTPTSYSISATLPAGLSFNTTTGVISGTPSATAASATYTVTATNAGGSTTGTVTIMVLPVAPSGLSYANINATVGTPIGNVNPTVIGTPTSYSISATLPAGLSFDTGTGVISGTPSATAASATYTVTATNAGGSTPGTVTIVVDRPVDTTAPVITLTGDASMTLAWGASYTDAGATATDNNDPSVTVTSSGSVNTAVPGTYTITYNARDAANNSATQVTRTVMVSAPSSEVGADGLSGLLRYAFGANGPSDTVTKPTSTLSAGKLAITAIVRTNNPNLTVLGQAVTNLPNYTSGSSIVTVSGSAVGVDQGGIVPAGCERQTFSVEQGTDAKKFLRLKATLNNP